MEAPRFGLVIRLTVSPPPRSTDPSPTAWSWATGPPVAATGRMPPSGEITMTSPHPSSGLDQTPSSVAVTIVGRPPLRTVLVAPAEVDAAEPAVGDEEPVALPGQVDGRADGVGEDRGRPRGGHAQDPGAGGVGDGEGSVGQDLHVDGVRVGRDGGHRAGRGHRGDAAGVGDDVCRAVGSQRDLAPLRQGGQPCPGAQPAVGVDLPHQAVLGGEDDAAVGQPGRAADGAQVGVGRAHAVGRPRLCRVGAEEAPTVGAGRRVAPQRRLARPGDAGGDDVGAEASHGIRAGTGGDLGQRAATDREGQDLLVVGRGEGDGGAVGGERAGLGGVGLGGREAGLEVAAGGEVARDPRADPGRGDLEDSAVAAADVEDEGLLAVGGDGDVDRLDEGTGGGGRRRAVGQDAVHAVVLHRPHHVVGADVEGGDARALPQVADGAVGRDALDVVRGGQHDRGTVGRDIGDAPGAGHVGPRDHGERVAGRVDAHELDAVLDEEGPVGRSVDAGVGVEQGAGGRAGRSPAAAGQRDRGLRRSRLLGGGRR